MLTDLPDSIASGLDRFIDSAKSSFGDDLRSIILYGSAAEGKLRPTSDVNLILVLTKFDSNKARELRVPLRNAQAAIRLKTMFLLESEVPLVVEDFAVKFQDILRRRRVLHGSDPFANLTVSRGASILRLKQVLMNLRLRLRASYVLRGVHQEQLVYMIADAAGPLRAAAMTILELEGLPAAAPKEALEKLAADFPGDGWSDVLAKISEARQTRSLPEGVADPLFVRLLELTGYLEARALKLVL